VGGLFCPRDLRSSDCHEVYFRKSKRPTFKTTHFETDFSEQNRRMGLVIENRLASSR
jgi:hypothetical protein